MPTWTSFCRNGHEIQKVSGGDLPELRQKECKQCGSRDVEFFSEVEMENCLEKATILQTVICQNLATQHQYSEIIPVYDVRSLFACREQDRSAARIRVKQRRNR